MNTLNTEGDVEETIAGIREGLADVEAGRTITLEEYHAEVLASRRKRDKQADFDDCVIAISEALADFDAGERGMLLEDYRAELEVKRQTHAKS